MKISKINAGLIALGILSAAIYTGCRPEKFDVGNGLVSTNLNPSFSVTQVSGKPNYYALKADETGVLGMKWDFGDGSGTHAGKAIDTAFFPDAGAYNVTLTVMGKGGGLKTVTQPVTVATSDPQSGNLVQGSKMQAGDDAKWTHVTYTQGVTLAIQDGKMVATGGNGGHAGVYQTIDVVAGKKYKVDMLVSGNGATDTWFEVYVGMDVPVAGSDYNSGGTRIALNTWAGCGKKPFSGSLSSISCSGNGNTVTFNKSGTAYLMIRTGGSSLGTTGIAFTNVTFRGSK
jgi:hypothetical protein